MMIVCPHCSTRVLPTDGACPSCRNLVDAPPNPVRHSPPEERRYPPPEEVRYSPPEESAPEEAGPSERVLADYRQSLEQKAPSDNPYQSPQSDLEPARPRSDSKRDRTLLWHFFSFEGRISRVGWWGGLFGAYMAFFTMMFSVLTIADLAIPPELSHIVFSVTPFLYIPFIWSVLAVQAKRWHDRDKTGWWTLIVLIPYVGGLWNFVEMGCLSGTPGPNRYGPDPTGQPENLGKGRIEDYEDPESIMDAAYKLDMLGDWAKAISLYETVAARWPEHADYACTCIEQINDKKSLS